MNCKRSRKHVAFASIIRCSSSLLPIVLAGCASTFRTVSSVEFEQPRANQGFLTQDATDHGLQELAQALLGSSDIREPIWAGRGTGLDDPRPSISFENPVQAQNIEEGAHDSATPYIDPESLNGAFGKFVALPKLSSTEVQELLAALQLKIEGKLGYRSAAPATFSSLPSMPSGLTAGPVLSRATPEGVSVIRMGHRRFLSQPTQLWIEGMTIATSDARPEKDPVINEIIAEANNAIALLEERKKAFAQGDLERRLIRLSYIDVAGAMSALKGFGINTAPDLDSVTAPLSLEQLPLVAPMPAPAADQVSLLGGGQATEKGPFELSLTPSVATPLPGVVNTAPASQIVVFFDPATPEQFGKVTTLLDTLIDLPERQIFVEGMVLEINEDGLKELGIEWQFKEGNFEWIAGSVAAVGTAAKSADLLFDTAADHDQNWVARLKALVREKKAEVLSRPSVLTVNNRQATIRVGTDIPIATSQQEAGSFAQPGTVAFNFKFLATGISLNVMPRANKAGDEVSLLIDTIVSAQVPGADLELRSDSGALLASAPTMATRRIQTYARIQNNTPFIIGGLVNKEHSTIRDKVPLLGDIPYLRVLFQSKRTTATKREVIVVLTPHVLEPAQEAAFGRFLPKDQDRFDQFGDQLFRDTYRIRSEDVFDLSFITGNNRLQHYRELGRNALARDFRLAEEPPFNAFANNRFPGEDILVRRMVWEVVRRLSTSDGKVNTDWLSAMINPERLILFESQQTNGGFNVQFLERMLAQASGAKDFDEFFNRNPGKALALTYYSAATASEPKSKQTMTVPIPIFRMIDCPDHKKTWRKLLWDLNQPDEQGRARSTILLRDRSDLLRLQRALIVKKIVDLNGGNSHMTLANFSLGKMLLMPEPKPDQFHPIDGEVARYFFEIEEYYKATLQVIEKTIREVDASLVNSNPTGRRSPTE